MPRAKKNISQENNSPAEMPMYFDPQNTQEANWPHEEKNPEPKLKAWVPVKVESQTDVLSGKIRQKIELPNNSGRGRKWFLWVLVILILISLVFFAYNYFANKQPIKTYSFNQKDKQVSGQPENAVTDQAEGKTVVDNGAKEQSFQVDNKLDAIYEGQKVDVTKSQNLPENKVFQNFYYNAQIGKVIKVSGSCRDKYYAILVFGSKDDYRKDPAAAKVNSAFACPSNGRFDQQLDLQKNNLSTGEYYFFVADQGETGLWYNPR